MRAADAVRWGACFIFVLTFHAAGAMALLAHWNSEPDLVANPPVIMIELAPVAVAPKTTPTEVAPAPVQSEAQPEPEPETEQSVTKLEPDPVKPIEKAELPPLPEIPQAEPVPVVAPPPKPVEKPKKPVEKPKEKKSATATPALPARPAPPIVRRRAPQHPRQAPIRTIPVRCQTGNRRWSPGSKATSAIRRKRKRAANTAWRSLPSRSTAAAAYTMPASCVARAHTRSTQRR